jgi:tripartite-type tricarboxylate transporter receptor subunit TctC
MDRRTLLKTGLVSSLGLVAPVFSAKAQATNYPDRLIKIVVAFGPGGSTDVTARTISPSLGAIMNQNIVIENKPGGGSNIGAAYAAKAAPDGYTLFLGTIANVINMSLYSSPGYDLLADFVPISQLSAAPAVLVVNPKLPINTVAELIAYAKANPDKLNFASSGVGTTPHLAGEIFNQRNGIKTRHIPYKGAAPALTDTISGVTDFGFKTALSAIPSIQAGRIRALAVAAPQRLDLLPDVPTLAEAGLSDFEITSWNGLFAPRGTSPEIVNKLSNACMQISQLPDVQKAFAAQAALSVSSTPENFKKFIETEIKIWGDVINSVGIKKL